MYYICSVKAKEMRTRWQTKQAGESRRYSCSIAADNNRAQAALHKGHLLRPREVTIDDRRRSSIKTQKQRYQSLGGRKQRCWEAQDDEAEKHTET